MFVLSLAMGWLANGARKEQDAVVALESAGRAGACAQCTAKCHRYLPIEYGSRMTDRVNHPHLSV
jgi:hypothetical protein